MTEDNQALLNFTGHRQSTIVSADSSGINRRISENCGGYN